MRVLGGSHFDLVRLQDKLVDCGISYHEVVNDVTKGNF